jgi:kinetochore protein Mis13/DSN1
MIIRASSARPPSAQPSSSLQPQWHADDEVDEDIRRMDSEADDLRRLSRANETKSSPVASSSSHAVGYRFPASAPGSAVKSTDGSYTRDKNKARDSSHKQRHQRRSSMGMRGKRVSTSFEATGVIGAIPPSPSMRM